MDYKRSDRVADLLREEIAELIQRRVKDPRVGAVTITSVTVSDDLRHAKVFYCVTGRDAEREAIDKGLEQAKGFIKAQLGRRIRLKHMPELQFIYDTSFDYADKIGLLLRKLHDHD
jgi:ribosome-binding factor A